MLVGTIVRCGQGKMTIAKVQELFDQVDDTAASEDFEKAPLCAPPDGLTLVEVDYPE